jgi:phosphinothricin acetyltransferase
MTGVAIRPCTDADAAAVCAIYNHYIRDTVVTFEETPLEVAAMNQRIADVGARFPWLVAEEAGEIVGYAYGTAWKARSAYRFTVESTVYLAPQYTGRGLGVALYSALLAELRRGGFHSVVGCIALPNAASVALHEKLGFKKIGVFSAVGWKFDRWVDVGYWELTIG